MQKHRLDIEVNAEGGKLAVIMPINEDGSVDGGYRIAGPKAWGGSKNIASLEISSSDLEEYVKSYAPDVLGKLKAENKRLTSEVERLETGLQKINDWCDAYPLGIFPEPDMEAARDALKFYGMTLDSVSASNMRHVLKGVKELITTHLKAKG